MGNFKVRRGIVGPPVFSIAAAWCRRDDSRGEGKVFVKRMKVGQKIVQGVEANIQALCSSAC